VNPVIFEPKILYLKSLVSKSVLDKTLAFKDMDSAAVHAAEEELLILTNGTRPEDVLISNTVNDPIDFLKYNTNIMPDKLSLARPSLEDVFIICTGSSRQ
jgi:hypothetical protein